MLVYQNNLDTLHVHWYMPANDSRPQIASIQMNVAGSLEESFQNSVLRPIIKMKHDLLIAYLRDYLSSKKNPLNGLNNEKQIAYMESVFQQDMNFRSELRGVVIGQFTGEEYLQYVELKSELNKRMISIIKKRMIDHLDILTK